jgi:hypothetical protein
MDKATQCSTRSLLVSQGRSAFHSFSPEVIGNEFPGDGSSFPEVYKALISLALMWMEDDGWS